MTQSSSKVLTRKTWHHCIIVKMNSYRVIVLMSLICATTSVFMGSKQSENKDVLHFTATDDQLSLEELYKTSAPVENVKAAVVCRDGTVCPSGSSCCAVSRVHYGCCPYEKAVCCLDRVHCCPEEYICDMAAGACRKGDSIVKWQTKHTVRHEPVTSVVCPGGGYQCPDGTTCCKMRSGIYGCCPYEEGVCCSDGIHCCPEGYTCNVAVGYCAKKNEVVDWVAKIASTPIKSSSTCKDDMYCSNGSTCCKMTIGQHGCCPLSQGVCCPDQLHCCPKGYTCKDSEKSCTKDTDFLTKVPMVPIAAKD